MVASGDRLRSSSRHPHHLNVTHPPKSRLLAILGLVALTVTLIVAEVLWLPLSVRSGQEESLQERDWVVFYWTGNRLADGRTREIYIRDLKDGDRPEFETRLYFLYPPFVVWLTRPLAGLRPSTAYALCVGAVVLATLGAFIGLLTLVPLTGIQRLIGFMALLASFPWNAAVMLGHLGALLILPPVLALAAWKRGRPFAAGCALGLLVAKPNWGIPILGLLILGRQWRSVAGFVTCVVGLALVSVPLGLDLWGDWLQTMDAYGTVVADAIPVAKQATLLAVVRFLFQRPGSDPVVFTVWVLLALLLMGWTARLWYTLAPGRCQYLPRLLGTSLLTTLVANPYAYSYDLLLLVPAALTLWTARGEYLHPVARRWALGVTAAAYWGIYAQLLEVGGEGRSFIGLFLAIWAVVELWELETRVRRQPGPADSTVAGSGAVHPTSSSG